ncbi:MAG: hypothetical protein ACTTKL_06480 [Treponema sp.]
MKRRITVIFAFLLITYNSFAKAPPKLKWRITYENFCKNFEPKLKYENEYFSVVYLPKNSVYKNEYDQYLLFSKDLSYADKNSILQSKNKLIGYLEVVTDLSKEECIKRIQTKYNEPDHTGKNYTNYDYLFNSFPDLVDKGIKTRIDLENSFEIFPSFFSAEVFLFLLTRPYDYGPCHGNGTCGAIFFQNKSYILYSYDMRAFTEHFYPMPDSWVSDFIQNRNKLRLTKLQKELEGRNGPFGTYWGMEKDDLPLICKDTQYMGYLYDDEDHINHLSKTVEYKSYYSLFPHTGKQLFKQIVPAKSSDLISEYYAVLDENKGLYQVFSIVKHYNHLDNYRGFAESDARYAAANSQAFLNMKTVLSEQYGAPQEVSKTSVYWQNADTKIELFSEREIFKIDDSYARKEYWGVDYLTCLVYTNTKIYNELAALEKKYK